MQEIEKEVVENGQDEAVLDEDVAGLDEAGQKVYGLVKEITELFKARIQDGELSPYEVAEAISIALSGTIYSTLPPERLPQVQKESDYLLNRTMGTFHKQSESKKMLLGSQLLASAKMTSYVMSHAHNIVKNYESGKTAAAEQAISELEEKVQASE